MNTYKVYGEISTLVNKYLEVKSSNAIMASAIFRNKYGQGGNLKVHRVGKNGEILDEWIM